MLLSELQMESKRSLKVYHFVPRLLLFAVQNCEPPHKELLDTSQGTCQPFLEYDIGLKKKIDSWLNRERICSRLLCK